MIYLLVAIFLTGSIQTGSASTALSYKEVFPPLPQHTQEHYIILAEGYRNDRIELVLYDAPKNCDLLWDTSLRLTNNENLFNYEKYYLSEDQKNWVFLETGYSYISDYATKIYETSKNVRDSLGNRILKGKPKTTLSNLNENGYIEEDLEAVESDILAVKNETGVMETAIQACEKAIEAATRRGITPINNIITLDLSAIKDSVGKAKEIEAEILQLLSKHKLDLHRTFQTNIVFDVLSSPTNLKVEITKDIIPYIKEIDNIKIYIEDLLITLPCKNLLDEMNSCNKLSISIKCEKGEENIYEIKFFKSGVEVSKLENKIQLNLPLLEKNQDYSCIFIKNGQGYEALGGQCKPNSNQISIETKESGKYYVEENRKVFRDIGHKNDETQRAINFMAAKGIISGKAEGVFDPDSPISRSEFSKLIVRVLYELDKDAVADFNDTKNKNAWDYQYIASAKKVGLVNGYPDNTFRGQNIITRQEIIKICASALEKKMNYMFPDNIELYLNFSDRQSIQDWVVKYVALAQREGIIVQNENNTFNALGLVTRGEAAVILYRLFNKL